VQEARKLLESAKEKLELTVQRDPYRNSNIPKVNRYSTVYTEHIVDHRAIHSISSL
jgi:hypothetical protein